MQINSIDITVDLTFTSIIFIAILETFTTVKNFQYICIVIFRQFLNSNNNKNNVSGKKKKKKKSLHTKRELYTILC